MVTKKNFKDSMGLCFDLILRLTEMKLSQCYPSNESPLEIHCPAKHKEYQTKLCKLITENDWCTW